MPAYRILIVDDQRDVRKALRSAVETLDIQAEVLDVPSGEEAILEIASEAVDLLVSDVRLAGISGLELLEKLRRLKPDMKVILVTGLVDARIRQKVADAGADAFFLKPLDIADFLDAVERCLGIVEASPVESLALEIDEPVESVSDYLTTLRQELNAIAAVLLDERGRVLARAGDLPDASVETALFPALMAAFSASGRVAQLLRQNPPNDLMYFAGSKYDVFLAHVGESYALLVAANPDPTSAQIYEGVRIMHSGLQDLLKILLQMGIQVSSTDHAHQMTPATEEAEEIAEVAPDIEAIFQDVAPSIEQEEVDAFWDTASLRLKADITTADSLTYEQARQLGLTPENGDEEE